MKRIEKAKEVITQRGRDLAVGAKTLSRGDKLYMLGQGVLSGLVIRAALPDASEVVYWSLTAAANATVWGAEAIASGYWARKTRAQLDTTADRKVNGLDNIPPARR